jgi:hypothetical protein
MKLGQGAFINDLLETCGFCEDHSGESRSFPLIQSRVEFCANLCLQALTQALQSLPAPVGVEKLSAEEFLPPVLGMHETWFVGVNLE